MHQGVKPSNVMYHDGHITLFDFSLAEPFVPGEALRLGSGTEYYKSPEQTNRTEMGYQTDVYGLGAVLYQLLTGGELPYPMLSNTEDARAMTPNYAVPAHPPSRFNPAVPSELDTIALRALHSRASERFATPIEFREALARCPR